MGFMDTVRQTLKDLGDQLSEQAHRFQNQSFADACMASCALIAMADGELQSEEKSKLVKAMQSVSALQCFQATDLRDNFTAFCNQAGDQFARIEVIKAVRKVRGDRDQADMVVKIALAIARSKGDLAPVEAAVGRELIRELGLTEGDYDLTSAAGGAAAPVVTPRPAPQPAPRPAPAAVTATRKPRVQGSSTKDAKAGERVSLKQLAGAEPKSLNLGFGWELSQAAAVTATAVIFDTDKKLLGKVGPGASTTSGVTHKGNTATTSELGDDEEMVLDLSAVPANAGSIVFTIGSGNQSAVGIKSAYVRVVDTGKPAQLLRFDFAPQGPQALVVAGRIYRHNGEWKFAAVGEAVRSGAADAQVAAFA